MVCQSCGQEVEKDARYCWNCGAAQVPAAAPLQDFDGASVPRPANPPEYRPLPPEEPDRQLAGQPNRAERPAPGPLQDFDRASVPRPTHLPEYRPLPPEEHYRQPTGQPYRTAQPAPTAAKPSNAPVSRWNIVVLLLVSFFMFAFSFYPSPLRILFILAALVCFVVAFVRITRRNV